MRHNQKVFNHINQKQLAERWDLSERTLERWRVIGQGPNFIKIGGRVVYRLEDILKYEALHLCDSTKSRVHHNKPAQSSTRSAGIPQATTLRSKLAEPDWKPITAEIQDGLLIFEIPAEFRCNDGDLEYCLSGGELRLRTARMSLEQALRIGAGK